MGNIIDNAKMAKEVWDEFIENDKNNERIRNYFHLRPTNAGVTVITTLSGYEMRGLATKKRNELSNVLKNITGKYNILVSMNNEKKKQTILELGFHIRNNQERKSPLEEVAQATMINSMSGDHNLVNVLDAKGKIEFIASELILELGQYRVDIVGFDGTDLYLFELKKDRTRKVEQVSNYVNYYIKNRGKLERLLQTYPMRRVNTFETIRGVMVMRYAENSTENWTDMEKNKNINILFYKYSLLYKRS